MVKKIIMGLVLFATRPSLRLVLSPTHRAALTSNAAVAPHRLLDARRIVGKPAASGNSWTSLSMLRAITRQEDSAPPVHWTSAGHRHPWA
jgi:hypothetical protein